MAMFTRGTQQKHKLQQIMMHPLGLGPHPGCKPVTDCAVRLQQIASVQRGCML